ncbi:EAL domain-containing protein [Idiomarina loihiensis]|uniref:EAL domain-containing protein n=1 Tax=Idiomarina loihiensis TaxID=135577 RepID=UPI00129CF8D2|nr:EAL domain-containing protein [Idiomarina loihiensis]MRJ44932.1 EAL domain-containing protein [Idiomarina loihiensis]UTW33115.1 EAL domain-containing protein [Idiomarina loihiensis]
MRNERELTLHRASRKRFFKRPEVILALSYIIAAIIWEIGAKALIPKLPVEADTKSTLIQWEPWAFVALSIIFLFFFIRRIWFLRFKKSRELLHSYLGNSPTVHYELRTLDSGFCVDWVSTNCERILGYSTEEVMAPGWWLNNIHPNDVKTVKKTALRGFEEEQFVCEYRFRHQQGHYVWVRDEVRRSSQKPLRFQGSWTNISADYYDTTSINSGKNSEHDVLSGIALLDGRRRVIAIDTPFTDISGLNESACLNSRLEELLSATEIDDIDGGFPCNQSILIVGRDIDKQRYSAILTVREAPASFPGEAAYIATLSDVTRMKLQQRQLQKLAFFNDLTGLPNSNSLALDLTRLLDELPSDRLAAVIVMNVNHFHQVNDQYGHHIGDKILQRLALRLKKAVPFGTKLYNLGGDEFAVVLNHIVEYIDIQNIILEIQAAYEPPFILSDSQRQVQLAASIGASVYPLDGYDAEKLLAQANLAMNSAKDEHNESSTYFKQELETRSYDEIQLEEDVRSVLQTGQMQLVYQPVLNMQHQVVGVEALLRWEHPDLGSLKPDQFLPQFDANGMLDTLGVWVVEQVIEQIDLWQEQDTVPGKIGINLATEQISQKLYQTVSQFVKKTPKLAAKLEFDLSESSLQEPLPHTLEIIEKLHQLGITLVIDRFGKGVASMLHLKTMPVSKIKIEREFIRDLDTNERSRNLVRAVIRMTSELGLEVQAVGVENQAQLDTLAEFGCHYWQGKLYMLPQTADTVFTQDTN